MVSTRFLPLLLCLAACGLEPLIAQPFTGEDIPDLPKAQPNVVSGLVGAMPGATLTVWTSGGVPLDAYKTTADAQGRWTLVLPGSSDFTGIRVIASVGQRSVWGLLPPVSKQKSVLDPERRIDLGKAVPAMGVLDGRSTTASLVLTRLTSGAPLAGEALAKGAAQVAAQLDAGNPTFTTLLGMVERLLGASPAAGVGPTPFLATWAGKAGATALDVAFLDRTAVDYDGDGEPDPSTAPFDAALEAAAGDPALKDEVQSGTCYPHDAMRVVFLVDLRPGGLDANCKEIATFKWASQEAGKAVFFTGGIHESAPLCDAERTTACVTKAAVDAANQVLGNWTPNKVPMYDDGTHGDAVAGDGVWTLAVALPYVPTATSPDGRGVRIGYKYTFGKPSQGWTATEEWPGNQRLLEVEDLDGDRLVVRFDLFGDETSNKDKANLRSPANGGCGVNKWESEKTAGCGHDTRENLIDTDGDCVPDAAPSGGTSSPLLCDEATGF
ncbi:MAG: hypothetical protein AMXMBFR64_51290 [Myxococcales bacterium]